MSPKKADPWQKLNHILDNLDSQDWDSLLIQVEEASALISQMKEKLYATEIKVEQLFSQGLTHESHD